MRVKPGDCRSGRGRALPGAGPALLVGAAVILLGGCAPSEPAAPGPPAALQVDPVPRLLVEPDPDGREWVRRTVESFSLEEAVGQLVFPWISGAYAAEDDPEFVETLEWVERYGIGGVAISIGTPHAYGAKLNALQRRAGIPLLVTSDFENGGPGMRINHSYALPTLLPQGGGTSFPPTMALGAVGDLEEVGRFAEITAREARAVGVHVNFAPVVDVNSNPENPIINTRAFGEDPEEVGRLGAAYIRGAREGGVLTTAKHFPGHGDTRVDSHLTLPEVTADRERLDRVELVPFQAAVAEGVDAVMTAHVSVPAILGPGAPPATLVPEFMTDLLRGEMGFTGLLFTDALRMGAITEAYGAGEAAVLSLEAGADVILIPESVPGAIEAIVDAVREGRVSRERIDASVTRILESKARLGLHEARLVDLEAIARVVGSRDHLDAADRIAARSITLPRDRDGLVPLDPSEVSRVLSITYAAPEDLTAGRRLDPVLAALLPAVEAARILPESGPEELGALLARAEQNDVVLFNAYVPPRAGAGTVALPEPVRAFLAELVRRTPTVLVSLGNPYILEAAPEVGSYLVAWGDREVSQRAAALALAGWSPIEGKLPITLPGLHERGEGLERAAIPAVAAREVPRGDALDEAGLLRAPDDPVDEPDDPADEMEEDDPVGAQDRPRMDPDGPQIPPGPMGTPAPGAWRELDVSPLEADPASVGMDPAALEELDRYIRDALADSVAPGAALAVARRGTLVRLRGYGSLGWEPESPGVTPFTVYDLASLTKVVGTTSALMILVQEGRVRLDDPVVEHLPGWDRRDSRKAAVTLRDLLLHRAGLPAYRAFHLEATEPDAVRDAIYDLELDRAPGAETTYSDIGFITLGWVVEAVTGESLDGFLDRRLFGPLGMRDTGFNPDAEERPRIAPTEMDRDFRGRMVHGEVHDENAFLLGGVAGHAGLFSTAQDLAVFARMLADGGMLEPCRHEAGSGTPCGAWSVPLQTRFLGEGLVAEFSRRAAADGSRALGWDTPAERSSAGDYFSERAFGHTGFTGTSIWVDPELELVVVLLTNRVHPTRDNARHVPFRREVHDRIARSIVDREVPVRAR